MCFILVIGSKFRENDKKKQRKLEEYVKEELIIKPGNIKSRVGLLKLRKKRRRKVKVQKMLQNERSNSTKPAQSNTVS